MAQIAPDKLTPGETSHTTENSGCGSVEPSNSQDNG